MPVKFPYYIQGSVDLAVLASGFVPDVLVAQVEPPSAPAGYTGPATEIYARLGTADTTGCAFTISHYAEAGGAAKNSQAVDLDTNLFTTQVVSWTVLKNDYFVCEVTENADATAEELAWQVRGPSV